MSTEPLVGRASLQRIRKFAEAFKSESDRGVAVLAMCVLEEQCRDALSFRLGPFASELLPVLAPRGRWQTLAAAIEAFGFITAAERFDIEILVNIRNAFSHKALDNLSFSHHDIKHQVSRLKCLDQLAKSQSRDGLKRMAGADARGVFIYSVSLVHTVVAARGADERAKPLVRCEELDYSNDKGLVRIGGW